MINMLDWIVIPGGPGLSNEYLKSSLIKPFSGYNLHFYHAFGSPESEVKDPTISAMVEQIEKIAYEARLNEYGLITHSFGNYLAMRAIERHSDKIKAIIMLNPIPFEYNAWKRALENIVKKVPKNILKQIEDLANNTNDGSELFRLIFPYYKGKNNAKLNMIVPFDIKACNTISAKVPNFDDKDLVNNIDIPLIRITGEDDPFFDDPESLPNQTIILRNAGHYPFIEDPEAFYEIINRIRYNYDIKKQIR